MATVETSRKANGGFWGRVTAGIGAALSLVYLLNFSMGFLEFIPDNIPIVGNIDEAFATWLLITCLRHLGLDLSAILGRNPVRRENADQPR